MGVFRGIALLTQMPMSCEVSITVVTMALNRAMFLDLTVKLFLSCKLGIAGP